LTATYRRTNLDTYVKGEKGGERKRKNQTNWNEMNRGLELPQKEKTEKPNEMKNNEGGKQSNAISITKKKREQET